METVNTKTPSKAQSDHIQSAAIMHAIEIESNFKLYSYRVISHEQFIARTKELIQFFNQSVRDANNK